MKKAARPLSPSSPLTDGQDEAAGISCQPAATFVVFLFSFNPLDRDQINSIIYSRAQSAWGKPFCFTLKRDVSEHCLKSHDWK